MCDKWGGLDAKNFICPTRICRIINILLCIFLNRLTFPNSVRSFFKKNMSGLGVMIGSCWRWRQRDHKFKSPGLMLNPFQNALKATINCVHLWGIM